MDMRGLNNFIRDVREATSSREAEYRRVAEELGKIRSKFKDSTSMTAYDRKKYVCKLLFIFMLGYEVDFGHMEAVELLAGHTPSEKLIGYLAISVLLHENHPLLMLTTHTMTIDLAKGAELQKTLALTAIANVANNEMVDSVAPHVTTCLMSRTVSIPIRKRAILAALHLFRKSSQCLDLSTIGPVIAAFVGSQDFAVATCACAFAEELLSHSTETREHVLGAKSAALTKLYDIIVDRRTPSDYIQYQVPAPWLQVKLLRVLQHFPPPSDEEEASKLSLILSKIIRASEKVISEVQHQMAFKRGANSNRSNLFVATLVEAVSLSILWDNDPVALGHSRDALGVLINDKRDPNVKSLGLLMLSRMSFCSSYNFTEHVIGEYQSIVVQALHDRDNSVRLRALDLLNAMCNKENAANVVGELQEYLKVAHPSIREDLVLLIAVLAEKFCAEVTWYVEVIMNLLEEAGQFIPEDVWHRLIHIIVNTPEVQKYSVSLLMKVLTGTTSTSNTGGSGSEQTSENASSSSSSKNTNTNNTGGELCSEVVVLVGCILLGEFGYQIALLPGSSPSDQLHALHSKWHNITESAKSTMLQTFVKFYNLYDDPQTRERIVKIFAASKTALDCEVQQRATEYHYLVTKCSDDVLLATLEPLPEFDVAADTLVARLRERQHGTGVKDHWTQKAQERDAKHMMESNVVKPTAGVSTLNAVDTGAAGSDSGIIQGTVLSSSASAAAAARTTTSSSSASNQKSDLNDLFDSKPSSGGSSSSSSGGAEAAVTTSRNTNIPSLLSSGRSIGRLLQDGNTVLIDVTAFDTRGSDVRMTLKISNPSVIDTINALSIQIANSPSGILLQMQPPSAVSISAGESVSINFAARAQQSSFGNEMPTINISFVVGSGKQQQWTANNVTLPIALSTFLEPYKTEEASRFQSMWESLGDDKKHVVETQKHLLSGVGGGISTVEKLLATSCHLHCFRPGGAGAGAGAGRNDISFAMGALAVQPSDAVQYTPLLVVAQEAPGRAGEIAVAFRSVDNSLSEVALKRFAEGAKIAL